MSARTVFLTFSLSQFGMAKFFFQNRHKDKAWARHIVIHLIGLILCVTILIVTVYEKFGEGGWVTLVITSILIGLCYLIRGHYLKVRKGVRQFEEILSSLPAGDCVAIVFTA
jgi:K+ transporter